MLVERSEENGLFEPFSGTDGSMGKDLYLSSHKNSINGAEISADGKVHQNGRAVYKWAVTTLSEGLGTLAAKNGISLDDVDIFLPHKTNKIKSLRFSNIPRNSFIPFRKEVFTVLMDIPNFTAASA